MRTSELAALPMRNLAEAEVLVCQVRHALHDRGVVLRAPPPVPDSCCGRGCNGCVWEGYYAALHWWREDARALLGG